MEVGQVNRVKVGAIIQARYSSVRLPGKVLLPLPMVKGKSVLEHIITALRRNPLIEKTFLATSRNTENDPIKKLADKLKVDCFSGDENDVFSRFISIIKPNNISVCVRLTGDNPLVDNNKLTDAINYLINENLDYIYTNGLPLGMNFEIFKSEALLKCKEFNLSDTDNEHVTLFLRDSGKFKTKTLIFPIQEEITNLRCTIDYPSDFAFMNLLMSVIDTSNNDLISEISKVYKEFTWIAEINSSNYQKKQHLNTFEEIELAKEILVKYDLKHAVSILERY